MHEQRLEGCIRRGTYGHRLNVDPLVERSHANVECPIGTTQDNFQLLPQLANRSLSLEPSVLSSCLHPFHIFSNHDGLQWDEIRVFTLVAPGFSGRL